ncbi:hypothetical protein AAJ76_1790002167 [Vairimorpha ceranae]|uniref:HTH marR-type domain-containing protein n=1 Tax=Vairimorpha ceranae TaxID=40302 RepID=A0A0F9YM96_9MICR|nr:hypothetical protein AAJ76_1790002167 [Vairimorpha ceranae]KKO73912.1 hypothetical protein AAJ76_1790002167 [Vairimorpha ceranae]
MQSTLKGKIEILLLSNKKMPQVEIARKFKILQSTIFKIVKNMKEKGTIERSKRFGRKKKLQLMMLQLYLKLIKKPKTSLRNLSIKL